MDMDAAGQKISIKGDTKVDATNPAMKMTMDMGPSMKLDMILVDKKVYMKGFPGLAAGKWAVIDSSSTLGKQLLAVARPGRPDARCTTSSSAAVHGRQVRR